MVYEYKCDDCGHRWEMVLTIAKRDEPLADLCPKCAESHIKRVPGAAAISYQGAYTMHQRAGNEWNDVLKGIKKAAGKNSTIQTR